MHIMFSCVGCLRNYANTSLYTLSCVISFFFDTSISYLALPMFYSLFIYSISGMCNSPGRYIIYKNKIMKQYMQSTLVASEVNYY